MERVNAVTDPDVQFMRQSREVEGNLCPQIRQIPAILSSRSTVCIKIRA